MKEQKTQVTYEKTETNEENFITALDGTKIPLPIELHSNFRFTKANMVIEKPRKSLFQRLLNWF